MLSRFKGICASLALFCSVSATAEDQLAFPGAAGWGRYALGARKSSTPTVYHVTNLNDSGSGSLRDAVSSGNRIVVFDVAGVIQLKSRLVFSGNSYIAGQTAPGEGITVYGNGVSFSGCSNIICRYLRIRMGHNGDNGKDCAGVASGSTMIFDHCSFSWGLDETFSINANDLSWEANITLMNCIIGQGLMVHSAGGLMQAKYVTLYRNLYIDNSTRNNKVKGVNQYANNVVYNWQDGCYIMGGDSQGESFCNITSNLFINGPAKGGNGLGGGNANFHFYGNDNWQDKDMNGVFAPSCIDGVITGGGDPQAVPYDYPELELYPGNELIEKNIPTVGASLPYRDPSDCYMIDELMSFGKKGALISNEEGLSCGAPSTWNVYAGKKKTDTDGDGMPDEWESANGTDPNAADATVLAANGYLNIENYINSITVDDRDYFLRMPATFTLANATTTTLSLTWADYTYGEEGFIVECKGSDDADYQEVAKLPAGSTSYTIENLKDANTYKVRVCAYDGTNKSEYNEIEAKTRPIDVALVDVDTYKADVTNTMDGIDDKALLLQTDDTLKYTLIDAVQPSTVVAKGKGHITITNLGNTSTSVKYSQLTADPTYSPESSSVFFNKATVSAGSNLTMDGSTFNFVGGAGNGAVMTKIGNQSGATLATTEILKANTATFTLSPVEGRSFSATKVSFRAASSGARCGAKLTATAICGKDTTVICTDAALTANATGSTKDIYTASVALANLEVSSAQPLSITFALKALTKTGYIGIDSLVVEGAIAGGVIAGKTSVNKADEGTLVLKTANTYTGATVLHDGVLEFNSIANGGVASAIGASVEYAQNWIMDGGTYRYTGSNASTNRNAQLRRTTTLEIANGKTITMNGNIEKYDNDDADFILDGTGRLTIPTTTFFGYKGKTIVKGGTLYLSTVDAAKAGIGSSKQLVLAGGKFQTKGESNNYETYSFPIEVEEGTYSYFAPNRNCYTKNKITGAGTFEYTIPYLREYWDANISEFRGKIVANGVSTDSWGSLFMSSGSFNMPTTQITLKGNTKMCMWTTIGNGYVGGLSGDAGTYLMASSKNTDGTSCSWTIGGSNSDEIFNGIINNSCCASGHTAGTNNITKVGTGYWMLTGKNPYTGTTVVNGGELIVNGTHSGTGKYTVNSDATLRGRGNISGGGAVTVNSGATLASGDTIAVANKTFTIAGPVTMKSGSTLSLDAINTTKYPYNQTSFTFSNLTIENGVTLEIDRSSVETALAADNYFTVFATVPATLSGTFSSISPEKPGEGLTWDTSELYITGKLYIRAETTAVKNVQAENVANAPCYNIAGQKVSDRAKGIVIKGGKKILK